MPAREAMTMTASAITSTKKAQRGGGRDVLVTIVANSRVSEVWGGLRDFAYLPLIRRSSVHGTHAGLALVSGSAVV